jgi:hypothetical protein
VFLLCVISPFFDAIDRYCIDQYRFIFSFGAYYKRESRRSDESNKDNKKQPKMKLHQAKASSKYELRVSNEKN